MRRVTTLVILIGLALALVAVLPGCSCSDAGGEGDRAVDVSMGGKLTAIDRLDFEVVSYENQQLQIRNRATEHPLEIGTGTPILTGDGTEVAHITNSNTIAPGATAPFALSGPLQVGQTYYLGAPQGGSKPTVRQLFICPGGSGGSGGGYNIPDVPEEQDVEIPE